MSSTGLRSYLNGTKNNWRRWQWNRICDRLKVSGVDPRDAGVLYLAGPDDEDRRVAKERGFRHENLVAVERDEGNAAALRSRGVLTFHGELSDAVEHPPLDRLDVVIADLCGGLSALTADLYASLCGLRPRGQVTIVAVNMLRGRDGEFGSEFAASFGKHRGKAFVNMFWVRILTPVLDAVKEKQLELFPLLSLLLGSDNESVMSFLLEAEFNSYKSGPQTFDSAVFVLPPLAGYARTDRGDGLKSKRQSAALKAARTRGHGREVVFG